MSSKSVTHGHWSTADRSIWFAHTRLRLILYNNNRNKKRKNELKIISELEFDIKNDGKFVFGARPLKVGVREIEDRYSTKTIVPSVRFDLSAFDNLVTDPDAVIFCCGIVRQVNVVLEFFGYINDAWNSLWNPNNDLFTGSSIFEPVCSMGVTMVRENMVVAIVDWCREVCLLVIALRCHCVKSHQMNGFNIRGQESRFVISCKERKKLTFSSSHQNTDEWLIFSYFPIYVHLNR